MQKRPMSFWEAAKLFWTRTFDFSGHSRRKEFLVPVFTQVLFYIISVVIYLFIMISGLSAIDTSSTDGNHEALAFVLISISVMIVFLCLISLILLIPNISLLVRRLHDISKSDKWAILLIGVSNILSYVISFTKYSGGDTDLMGIYLVINLIIVITSLVFFVWTIIRCVQDSQPGPNQWGPNPKEMGNNYENPYYSNYHQHNPYQNQYQSNQNPYHR